MTKAGDEVATWAQRIREERTTGARLLFPKASTLAQGFGELDAAAQRDLIRELLVDDDSSAAFDRERARCCRRSRQSTTPPSSRRPPQGCDGRRWRIRRPTWSRRRCG